MKISSFSVNRPLNKTQGAIRKVRALDRKFNRGGWSIGPGPLPREQRGAGFGATATGPVRLAGCSACGPDG